MNKIKELKAKFVAKRAERELNEDGFSLLELVVAIGIMLILTVGGLIGYSQITDNARKAAVESGASSVMTAAMVYESNGDDPQKAATDFNASSSNNQITADVDESTNAEGDKCFTVTVTHSSSGKVAERSNCTN